MSKKDAVKDSGNVVPLTRRTEVYTDSKGNKIVEPIFYGTGGVGGIIGIKR